IRCYDPKTNAWSDWPSLPEKVSSHDALVMDDVLYVVGGWKLEGPGDEGAWHEHGWSLNLNHRDEGWKVLPAMPATLRAGTVSAAGGELWWVGGMGDDDGASNAAFAYDPKKGSWREGPELPGTSRIKAFGSSTFSVGDRLFNSGMDGVLYTLDPLKGEWAVTPVNHQRARIFHRSLPVGGGVFWTIAGAAKNGHCSDIEVLPIPGQFPVISSETAWQSFRGGANNEVSDRKMAERWGDDSNVAWKVTLPGYGQSTPVFGDGGIYVTHAIEADEPKKETEDFAEKAKAEPTKPENESAKSEDEGKYAKGESGKPQKAVEDGKDESTRSERRGDGKSMAAMIEAANGPMKTGVAVTRIDQKSGKISWTATLTSSNPEPRNQYRSCAAPSPCVDDRAVYAWFESGDLVALDHEGKKLWHRNIGVEDGLPKGNHGFGGSLVQDQESLYLLVDHDGPGYLLSLDKKSGGTRWKVDREKRVSWSTPVVTDDAIIISSNGLVEERDKATGEQRWAVEGIEGNTVASPLVFQDYVLAPSSEKGQTRLIRRGQAGERVVWVADEKATASFASPVFAQGQFILVSKASIASGLDWNTGEELWNFRLPEGCWATPVVLGKNIYFFATSGATLVTTLSPGGLQELHRNDLAVGSSKVYGVIPAGDQWIIRTGSEVTAVAKTSSEGEES
ncbi:MAG: PQQ-binding-like beta-propeller repeat protein, partial [Verrucomicrobiae bacterium]|nr:PQQ-binding-like beta-propeller repeat protein [Verrucomicrobiae bacterium]